MNITYRKLRDRYAAAALGCLLFAFVYELFSHGVFSPFLLFAFALPLFLGAAPAVILGTAPAAMQPGTVSRNLYHSGLATFTTGCLFRGVLEIYGTTSRLEAVYWAAGTLLLLAAVGMYLAEREERRAAERASACAKGSGVLQWDQKGGAQ